MEHDETTKKSLRGFASLSPQRRSEIAKLGGLASHRLGRAHTWDHESASRAGKIGGTISRRKASKKTKYPLSNTES